MILDRAVLLMKNMVFVQMLAFLALKRAEEHLEVQRAILTGISGTNDISLK